MKGSDWHRTSCLIVTPQQGGPAVGLLDGILSIFGLGGRGGAGSTDRGLYVYIRCNRCQDVVRVRINVANEVSELTDEPDDGVENPRASNSAARYTITKGVVDTKCFRPMRLTMLFDGRRRELERTVEGGTVVEQEDWEAARSSRQPPA